MNAPKPVLKLKSQNQISTYDLNLPFMTIGSAPEASIKLPKGTCDERHCRIEKKDDDKYIIRDLRSSTGTFVNGARVLEAYLGLGDSIRINEFNFEFSPPSSEVPKGACPALTSKNARWKERLDALPGMARTAFPILILGPSGSGKELIARALHDFSYRNQGPFMSVNCSALSESLIESELFGHIRGSFTGAINDRKGAFESARGGTLFLDEIGDLPYSLQAKLLRALENNEIRPVGSDRIIRTDVRIVAATHQNLHHKVVDKSFRSDLFYRLNVIGLQTPALLDRMEDFEDIFFDLCRESRVRFSHQAIANLKKHRWPGNIRELKNVVSRGAALYTGQTIDEMMVQNLLDYIPPSPTAVAEIMPLLGGKTNLVKEMEKQMILNRLIANRGNQRRTAEDLGMPKSTLNDRIKSYRINLEKIQFEETT